MRRPASENWDEVDLDICKAILESNFPLTDDVVVLNKTEPLDLELEEKVVYRWQESFKEPITPHIEHLDYGYLDVLIERFEKDPVELSESSDEKPLKD